MVMMKWGKKKWKLSKKKIMSLEQLSYSMSYNTEDKKKEPRTISVPYTVYREFGVNVKKEVSDWNKFLGKSYGLYIGKKRFGPKKMKLTGVDVSDINITPKGVVQSASISLSLEEVKK